MVSYIPKVITCPPLIAHQADFPAGMVCSVISGRQDRSGRSAYVRQLARHLEVHQYGKRGNRRLGQDLGRETKLSLIARYRFTLAFENAIERDYVTEKFYDPLLAGSVPVYLGAPNIEEFAPADGCYINAADFSGPAELAEYLRALDHDEARYAGLLHWRDRPLCEKFLRLQQLTCQPELERLCRLLAGEGDRLSLT